MKDPTVELDFEYRGCRIELVPYLGYWGYRITFGVSGPNTEWRHNAGKTYAEVRQYAQNVVDFALGE